ncbi:MAG: outer membrane beta-barrel domain-containing protein [Candidatus Eisenbacteria bacterium]
MLAEKHVTRALWSVALACSFLGTAGLARAQDSTAATVPSLADVTPSDSARTLPNSRPVVGKRLVELRGKGEHVLRSGPGADYAIVATRREGESFPVLAKAGDWYGVRLSPTETGWIHASLVKERDDLSDLEFRPNARLYSRTGSFVLGGYGGGYAFDEKSNSAVIGGRLGYYVFDRIVAEAGVSWTRVNRPAEIVESLFGVTLEAEKFSMLFYQMNVAWELLPGRQMVPYVSAGAGSTLLLGRSEPAFNFGAGTRMFLSRRAAMRWDVRDYRFTHHTGTHPVRNDNIEFTLGSEILF